MKHKDKILSIQDNFTKFSNEEILYYGAKDLGISLSEDQIYQFILFLNELKSWSRKIGLTSIRNDRDIIIKHFIDSMTPIFLIPCKSNVLDLGSGAGFPSIPLKIIDPSLFIVSIDSSFKKIYFQKHIIRTLNLKNILIFQHRIENGPSNIKGINLFDAVISRAVSNFKNILSLSKSYLKEKGRIILMFGKTISLLEVLNFSKSIDLKIDFIIPIRLPFLCHQRNIISFVHDF